MDGRKILVADDHPLSREGLALAVRHAIPGARIVTAGTIADAEISAKQRGSFALVLLDLMLPDTRGFSGLLRMQFCLPQVPVVVITAHEDATVAATARDLGAAGFLPKSTPLDEIAQSLREIVDGKPVFPQFAKAAPHGFDLGRAGMSEAQIGRADEGLGGVGGLDFALAKMRDRIAQLSEAQRRVLFALPSGRANKQIAHELGITEATVKAHLTVIFRRLGVTNRMQALLALRPLLGEAVQ